MSLYRAYRPQQFAAIVGQDHVKRTISNAVAQGTVAHAYLFSGPRGIGKTSIARILAMTLNCTGRKAGQSEPCGSCTVCGEVRKGNNLNVVEIDAASNRGIDEIRTLKEGIAFAPTAGGTKVYIIDEVHMLTKEAFNALLKTLEEPPAHAIFVLATTELHRLPETIISRTQHFEFKRATVPEIVEHLRRIAGEEKLVLDDEALTLIAVHADGGFRDALSLLDQLAALGEPAINAESVRLILGIAPEAELIALVGAARAQDYPAVHAAIERFATHGYDPASMTDALVGLMRQALWQVAGIAPTGSEAAQAFAKELAGQESLEQIAGRIERLISSKEQLRWSPLPYLPLELALLPAGTVSSVIPVSAPVAASSAAPARASVVASVEPVVAPEPIVPTVPAAVPPAPKASAPIPPVISPPTATTAPTIPGDLPTVWKAVIEQVRPKNASLAALLRSAQLLDLTESDCRIEVPFSFYADRIKDTKSVTIIAAAFASVVGSERGIQCSIAGAAAIPMTTTSGTSESPARSSDDVARDIVDVFGAVEATSG